MRRILASTALLSLLALGACQGEGGTPSLDTDEAKASYGLGFQTGSQMQPAESHIDRAAYMAGFRDGLAGAESAVSDEDIQASFDAMSTLMQEEQMAAMAEASEKNTAEGEAFLAENATKEGVIVTESGLQYEVLREGDGPRPGPEDRVTIHYRGTLLDGTEFDTSYDGGEPATFGVNGVIAGFSEGLQLMPVGSQYRFVIPGELAYGPQGSGGVIGPNATLIFEVEMLEIVQ